MKKRMLAMLLTLCMVITLAPVTASAAEIVESGACGDNLTWTLDDNGVLTISGEGAMKNFTSYSDTPWHSSCGTVKMVVLQSGVTRIGNYAFNDCYNMASIEIPNSTTGIGDYAFEYCRNLTSLTIPDSVTSIGSGAFYECSSLTSVTIPDSVTSIGSWAFYKCSSLTSVTIPNSITSIGDSAFMGCISLKDIAIPDGVTNIEAGAFYGCHSLTSVTIPNGVTSIGAYTFWACTGLVSIEIPDSVTSMEVYAFGYCTSLTSVMIPAGVTSIGDRVFGECSNLSNIEVAYDNPMYKSIDGVLMDKTGTKLLCFPEGRTNDYVIPDSVTCIGEYAFFCSGLTNVEIPDSVTCIGDYAFFCSGLTNVEIPDSVTIIGNYAFLKCRSLTSVTIPDSVTSIDGGAFESCSSLTSVTIPDGVTSIGGGAFESCSSLTSVTIPASVTSIGDYTFRYCSSLANIEIPNSVTSIGGYAFCGTSLEEVIIPNGVTIIGWRMFEGCHSLTSVTIPDSVTSIRGGAFASCRNLTSVTIPDSVTSIEEETFYNCSSLKNVTIPDSVKNIEEGAFDRCASLTDVFYTGSEAQWKAISINRSRNIYLNRATIHYYSGVDTISFTRGKTCSVDQGRQRSIMATVAGNYAPSDISWSSSDPRVAKIVQTEAFTEGKTYMMALIEGVSSGSARITVRTSDGKSAGCKVVVDGQDASSGAVVRKLKIQGDEFYAVGDQAQLLAIVEPSDAVDQTVTWSSSDSGVAKVNTTGKINCLREGDATITARSASGMIAELLITVCDQRTAMGNAYNGAESYRYSFSNSVDSYGYDYSLAADGTKVPAYKIPVERYLEAGISRAKALLSVTKWNGSCFGMCASSTLFFKGKLQTKNYGSPSVYPSALAAPSGGSASEIKLREMIELFQVSQKRSDFTTQPFSFDKILKELDNGNPVMLNLKSGLSHHTVLIYGYSILGGSCKFQIYDTSNYVSSLNYTNEKDYEFGLIDDTYDWKINNINLYGTLSSVYQAIKNSNVKNAADLLADQNTTEFTFPAVDLTISNSSELQSAVSDGTLSGDMELTLILPGYLAEEPFYTIIAPTDAYTIIGPERFSAADDWMGVDVAAPEGTPVTISEDLRTISIDCAEGDDFSVAYTTFDNLFDELTISGTAAGPVVVSLAEDSRSAVVTGAAALTATATVSETPTEVSAEELTADTVTVLCEETADGVTLRLCVGEGELSSAALAARQQTEAPAYDLESGTYDVGQTLTFTKDDDTLIYYTLDGSEPTEETGLLYTLPIEITRSVTVKAIAVKYGYTPSETVTLEYLLPILYAPAASVLPGSYDAVQYVDLTAEAGAEMYYTTDGSDPLENGLRYGASIVLTGDTCLKACAVKDGLVSDVITYEYQIDPGDSILLVNTPADQDGTVLTAETLETLTALKLRLENFADAEQQTRVTAAFYDAAGKMIVLCGSVQTLSHGENEVTLPITKNVTGAATMKLLLLTEAYQPKGAATTFKIIAAN